MKGFSNYDEVLTILLDIDQTQLDKARDGMSLLDTLFKRATQTVASFVGALAAVDAGIVSIGVAASKKASEFEALEISLNAVEGSAKRAKASLAELRDIARGPGLGVQSAIETYSGLRRGGIDHDLSMSITKEIGNAIAFTGGGREELSRIGIALSQIAVSPTLRGQDVMQLAQARLPVYQALKNQFGTADTEELQRMGITAAQALKALRDEFAKLPRVAGGTKNAFENASDAWDYALVQFGKGINEGILPIINDFTDTITKMSESGVLKDFGREVVGVVTGLFETVTGQGATAQNILDGVMESVLAISIGSANFAMNLQDFWNWLVDSVDPTGTFRRGAEVALGGDANSPIAQARQMIEDDSEQRAAKAKLKDKTTGNESEPPPPEDPAKAAVPLLKDIRENTKPIQRFMDAILGGGAAIKGGASVHNLAGMSGPGGSNRHIRMIIDGLQGLQGEMAANMGRGVNPKSF